MPRWLRLSVFAVAAFPALCALSAVACSKGSSGSPGPDAVSSASASVSSSVSAVASAPDAGPPAPKLEMHAIAGLGDVPAWVVEKRRSNSFCGITVEGKTKLDLLAKGDDAALSAGTADVEALRTALVADCLVSERAVAQGLLDGARAQIAHKKLLEASRFLRASIVMRASFVPARYELVRTLVALKNFEGAAWLLADLVRAAKEGDSTALSAVERAKTDKALEPIHEDDAFKAALAVVGAVGLVGPRKDDALDKVVVPMLPNEYVWGPKISGGLRIYHPGLVDVWTWRPTAAPDGPELIVATIIHERAAVDVPQPVLNTDYGAIAILRPGKTKTDPPTLIYVGKTGIAPPQLAATKTGAITFGFTETCGDLKGMILWKNEAVVAKMMTCSDPIQ